MPRKKEYARLKPGEMTLFVHGWPRELQKRLRTAAAKAGRSMKAIVTEAVEKWLKEKEDER